ncbi:hypothetical protein ACFXA3_08660, partial [Streptomyces sp. NPDC059456]|uniref:hypothetical protein n=1 Tax=Streptomyces sp. NPDC059456 TaxID=3346838 RepID=UPI003699F183
MLDSRSLLKDPALVAGRLGARGVDAAAVDRTVAALTRSRDALRRLEEARGQARQRGMQLSRTVREGALDAEALRAELKSERERVGLLEQAHQQAEG